jgi:biopolymer transport protein ExbD/biopolymer transport protein TolR
MAFSTADGGTRTALAEINVTPLVDVILVLLIIFMITAPVIQSGIDVSVPKTRNTQQLTEERLVVTIDRAGNVYVGDKVTNINIMGRELRQRLLDPSRQDIYVRADERVPWGSLAQVMDAIKQSGLNRVSLVTQPYSGANGAASGR